MISAMTHAATNQSQSITVKAVTALRQPGEDTLRAKAKMATEFYACMSRATMAKLSVPTSLLAFVVAAVNVIVSDVADSSILDAKVLLLILVPLNPTTRVIGAAILAVTHALGTSTNSGNSPTKSSSSVLLWEGRFEFSQNATHSFSVCMVALNGVLHNPDGFCHSARKIFDNQ